MSFQGRAFYNLLQMDLCKEAVCKVADWQILDYRSLNTSELLLRLKQEDVLLDLDSFHLYADKCDSPEEIAEVLVGDQDNEERLEKAYLIIFELWRRYCKEKESLSVFADELDYQIFLYEQGAENQETLQQMLSEGENILYENTKEGENPRKVFDAVSCFLAHNLEEFIYDFAADEMDEDNYLYASDIIDGFYDYVEDPRWLDFLKVRAVARSDVKEATRLLENLLERLEEDPHLDLYFEILRYLSYEEGIPLFKEVFNQIEPILEKEEDFQDLLEILIEYFNSLDQEAEENAITALLNKRAVIDKEKEFSSHELDFLNLKKLIIKNVE
jgi:hypothetical protein